MENNVIDVTATQVEDTTTPAPEIPDATTIDESGMKMIQAETKALHLGVGYQTRALLNMLTSKGIKGNMQLQIKQTIERAILAALDYGVDINGEEFKIRDNGRLGKLEKEYAGSMAKLKELGMVLMAKKMDKANYNLQDFTKGESSPEVVTETQTETLNQGEI